MLGGFLRDRATIVAATVATLVMLMAAHYFYYRKRRRRSSTYLDQDNLMPVQSNDSMFIAGSKNVLRCYSMTSECDEEFSTLGEVSAAIRDAGLVECKLIIGIDFTASNALQGDLTFGGRELHCIDEDVENPYQQVIRIIGHTLAPFDKTGIIRGYGFGDSVTKGTSVFELDPKYHILVIIADGQVVDEMRTRNAIVAASLWPLSIIMVGVGDGPWGMMQAFDQRLPSRKFDNFHFVDFNAVIDGQEDPEYQFALNALMEIPKQYLAIKNCPLLNTSTADNDDEASSYDVSANHSALSSKRGSANS